MTTVSLPDGDRLRLKEWRNRQMKHRRNSHSFSTTWRPFLHQERNPQPLDGNELASIVQGDW